MKTIMKITPIDWSEEPVVVELPGSANIRVGHYHLENAPSSIDVRREFDLMDLENAIG